MVRSSSLRVTLIFESFELIRYLDGASVYTVLEKGLQDLMDMCDIVQEKFVIARDEFKENKMQS